MLTVKLFGPGEASYAGRALAGFPHQQSLLLLCYLLLNPHYPHHRDQISTLFWGEYPSQISRKYLRNGLWKLRQILEATGIPCDDYLLVSDESVAFISTSRYWTDVEAFEKRIQACQDTTGSHLTAQQAEGLEAAVNLYTGDLLVGVYDDWCIYERERLCLHYLSALGKLMAFYEQQGQYERGLACGNSILVRDNTRENVHGRMMRLHWLLGNRHAALAQYKRCAQVLREELGIAPMKETTAAYLQMLNLQYRPYERPAQGEPAHAGGANQPSVESALVKLQHLQSVIEEAGRELRYLESLINAARFNSE
jgi:DNA-binding SARP family transcriptional activator